MNTIKIKRRISSSQLRIAELKDFMGKHVEITITVKTPGEKPRSGKAAGILSGYKDKGKIGREKQAWYIAAKEKHGNR
ncbi:MAG: hypothetical protein AB2L24_13285 [Mangrovibacterium sp.]